MNRFIGLLSGVFQDLSATVPARDFLSDLDRELVNALTRACARIAASCRDALLAQA